MDLQEVEWGSMDWFDLLRIGTRGGRALVNAVVYLRDA
jgi:hypothetical protein